MKETTTQYSIKYRPRVWEDVYGQDLVVKSLKERVINNNFPKAILLEGKFGTGKTSICEIFAACMQANLPDGNPDWDHPSNKPILNETFDRDTQRLDGSQIGGKMDIVEFTSLLRVKPMYDKKRIFIIEEADQLSTSAMNALLKVLEDPSPNVHFILLSMMDKKGVSNAIKSRCQVFKLKDIGIADLMKAMKNVMVKTGDWKNEEIPNEFRLEGLKTIAEYSEGSLRVALQNLETCIVSKTYETSKIAELLDKDDKIKTFNILDGLLNKTADESIWQAIFDMDAMQLYNYMTVLLSEAILYKETKFAYDERQAWTLKKLASNPNVESLYYNLILHPQMNKPFMRTADLIGALVGYYQGFNFMTDVNKPSIKINKDTSDSDLIHLNEKQISNTEVEKDSSPKTIIGTKEIPAFLKPKMSEMNPKIAVRTVVKKDNPDDEIPW